jgi:hypothetical protein
VDTDHSLFCNWVKNTSKLGKPNCASLCFCPHIENSDHAYKAKEALDSLAKRGGGMEKLLNSNDILLSALK